MMCEKCGMNPVAVTLTKVINGKKSVVKLCASCAQENNIYKDLNMDLGFSSLFSSSFFKYLFWKIMKYLSFSIFLMIASAS